MSAFEDLHRATSSYRPCPKPDCEACGPARVVMAKLEADAQALADVRTLDEWARANPDDTIAPRFRGEPFAPPEQQWEGFVAGEWEFFPSADAARAASAAWVRGQKP